MGVFAFIAKKGGDGWSAKHFSKEGSDDTLTAEAATTAELERALVKLAQSKASGGVQLSFNQITPKSAVIVVSVGAVAVAAAAPAAGGAAPAAGGGGAAAPAKKEEPSEEDEDMGFSLFD